MGTKKKYNASSNDLDPDLASRKINSCQNSYKQLFQPALGLISWVHGDNLDYVGRN